MRPANATTASAFARDVADELERLESAMPRAGVETAIAARIRSERDDAAMRAAAGRGVEVHASSGSAWTVVLEDEAALRPAPLHRFLRVHPVGDLAGWAEAMAPHRRHLSTVAIAGGALTTPEAAGRLARAGAVRLCPPGHMQAPPLDWPHDGRPVLEPLARWLGVESGP